MRSGAEDPGEKALTKCSDSVLLFPGGSVISLQREPEAQAAPVGVLYSGNGEQLSPQTGQGSITSG